MADKTETLATTAVAMSHEDFWRLIQEARDQSGGDAFKQVDYLRQRLSLLSGAEIAGFALTLAETLERALRWHVFGGAYVITDSFQEDGFLAFRAWLVAQGKTLFEAALLDPDCLADHFGTFDIWLASLEEMCEVAKLAYKDRTGNDLAEPARPDRPYWQRMPDERQWNPDNLENFYPRLVEKKRQRPGPGWRHHVRELLAYVLGWQAGLVALAICQIWFLKERPAILLLITTWELAGLATLGISLARRDTTAMLTHGWFTGIVGSMVYYSLLWQDWGSLFNVLILAPLFGLLALLAVMMISLALSSFLTFGVRETWGTVLKPMAKGLFTSRENLAKAEENHQKIWQILKTRFGVDRAAIPAEEPLLSVIESEFDVERLSNWFEMALKAESFEAFSAAVRADQIRRMIWDDIHSRFGKVPTDIAAEDPLRVGIEKERSLTTLHAIFGHSFVVEGALSWEAYRAKVLESLAGGPVART